MLYIFALFLLPPDENCMNVCFVSVDTVNKYYTILYNTYQGLYNGMFLVLSCLFILCLYICCLNKNQVHNKLVECTKI